MVKFLSKFFLGLLYAHVSFASTDYLMCHIAKIKDGTYYDVGYKNALSPTGSKIKMSGKFEEGFFKVKTLFDKNKFFEILNLMNAAKAGCDRAITKLKNNSDETDFVVVKMKGLSKIENKHGALYELILDEFGKHYRYVLFGDSLSDEGNLNNIICTLPGKNYFAGRFSNGHTWTGYARDNLGIAIQNWAVAGSTAGYQRDVSLDKNDRRLGPFLGVRYLLTKKLSSQVRRYLKHALQNNATNFAYNTKYIFFIGGNDYLTKMSSIHLADRFINDPSNPSGGYLVEVKKTVGHIFRNIRALVKHGAKKFIVVSLPDLRICNLKEKHFREFSKIELNEFLKTLTDFHNEEIYELSEYFKNKYEHISIDIIDLDFIELLNEHGFLYGDFTSETNFVPFLSDNSKDEEKNINDYILWDSIHPTTQVHEMLAKIISKQL